ncbi:alpha/beta hydrolase [Salipaludibacillus sp. LMS25]|jgi:acetyl esterase|uniref:alpha/beta hydrolase n=1 Tax=Salipaludibacillus sp. LMS25 TaxID=2924031 RepID=UPI0020D079E5|nr:alpha/beta hydrolase [Salipaludibacillus sp. LMS25]UTR14714.1 alpha/beta hydrolase [Salipaludibacillus sp. LMS25]
MKWAKVVFKHVILITSILIACMLIIISISVYLWQTTDEGRLPAKTAVVLHAINNNLVNLDITIRPPAIVSSGNSGGSPLLREDLVIPVQGGVQIPVRLYRPQGEGPFPILMYYHGGAFIEGYGSLETHDNIIRSLASRTNSIVIAPSYRLAPDYVFPTAVEDSYSAIEWAVEHAESFNGDRNRLSVVGDSAGGNIATVMTLMARDRHGPDISAQVLLYPLTTFQDVPLESREIYDSGYYLLSRQVMYLARDLYTPDELMWSHPYTSPLQAENLSDLPPTLIITAEFDPLRDEGEAYAERLAEFQVPVRATRYRGVMHGFISFYEIMQSGRYGLQETASFLRQVNQGTLDVGEAYNLQVRQPPQGFDRVRDQTEAFAIAAYLIGRSGANLFSTP